MLILKPFGYYHDRAGKLLARQFYGPKEVIKELVGQAKELPEKPFSSDSKTIS